MIMSFYYMVFFCLKMNPKTKDLHGVMHVSKWIRFHGLLDIALGLSKEVGLIQN